MNKADYTRLPAAGRDSDADWSLKKRIPRPSLCAKGRGAKAAKLSLGFVKSFPRELADVDVIGRLGLLDLNAPVPPFRNLQHR
jgi:hypothetical protein